MRDHHQSTIFSTCFSLHFFFSYMSYTVAKILKFLFVRKQIGILLRFSKRLWVRIIPWSWCQFSHELFSVGYGILSDSCAINKSFDKFRCSNCTESSWILGPIWLLLWIFLIASEIFFVVRYTVEVAKVFSLQNNWSSGHKMNMHHISNGPVPQQYIILLNYVILFFESLIFES